jgi:hypothetical protein
VGSLNANVEEENQNSDVEEKPIDLRVKLRIERCLELNVSRSLEVVESCNSVSRLSFRGTRHGKLKCSLPSRVHQAGMQDTDGDRCFGKAPIYCVLL